MWDIHHWSQQIKSQKLLKKKKKKKKINKQLLMQFNLTILSKQVKKNNQNDDEMSY